MPASVASVQTVAFPALAKAAIAVYPNAVSGQAATYFDLSALPQDTYRVTVADMAGRTVRTFSQTGGSQEPLPLAELPAGSY